MNFCFEFPEPTIINTLRSYIKKTWVFHKISKHFEVGLKNSAAPRCADIQTLLSVRISDETLFLMFDILNEDMTHVSNQVHLGIKPVYAHIE